MDRSPLVPFPPATSTLPLVRRVAECRKRSSPVLPVSVHLPVAGSYSSALDDGLPPTCSSPPTTSTFPSASSVAVCCQRALFSLPVSANVADPTARAVAAALGL